MSRVVSAAIVGSIDSGNAPPSPANNTGPNADVAESVDATVRHLWRGIALRTSSPECRTVCRRFGCGAHGKPFDGATPDGSTANPVPDVPPKIKLNYFLSPAKYPVTRR